MTTGKQPEPFPTQGPFPCLFGPYVIVNYLGEGGMGRVYLALTRDRHGEHLFVVKRFGNPRARFTPPQILENQARFQHEADITKALSHPCIARTFTSVHQGQASYLVQEFIHGLTLDYLISLMNPQRMPVPLAAHIIAQIAGALHYVHEFHGMGLIHRDLTAENVMFSRTGEVKVIDFGIAKATLLDETLTKPNIVVGKPLWTAPEVAGGAKPDRRADLYALGMLFWHLLCGENPEGHLDIEKPSLPSPSTLNSEVSAHIDAIVAKALHSNPKHRFQTAQELLDVVSPLIPEGYQGPKELARLVVGYDVVREMEYFNARVAEARPLLEQACPTPKPFSRRKVFLIAIISAIAALALGFLLFPGSHVHSVAAITPGRPAPTPNPPPMPLQAPPSYLPETSVFKPEASLPPQQPSPPQTAEPLPHQVPPSPSPSSPPPISHRSQKHPSQPQRLTATSSQPIATPPLPSPEELLTEAMDNFQRTDLPRTLSLARASAHMSPSPDAYILIARALFESDPAGAQAALETALRLSPGNRQAVRLLEQLKQRNP
jgi:serine/threonine-protein kinase